MSWNQRNRVKSSRRLVGARIRRNGQPDLPRHLFWDADYDSLDWKGGYDFVIERVLDRGNDGDYEALIRYYGRERILKTLKEDTIYLMDHSMERACAYFKLKPEELRCYTWKRSRGGHWI
jgi:uncharacterized protein DUF6922